MLSWFALQVPAQYSQGPFQSSVILYNRHNANNNPDENNCFHDDNKYHGDSIWRIGCQDDAANQDKDDQRVNQSAHPTPPTVSVSFPEQLPIDVKIVYTITFSL